MAGIQDERYYPSVGFYFRVDLAESASAALEMMSSVENSFQEVSGISVEYETESANEGSDNRFTHSLPTKKKHPNLVLKRGLVTSVSKFNLWCINALSSDLSEPVEPKNITVTLLNEKGIPKVSWVIYNAYPIKMQVSDLQALENKIAVETMEFQYQYLEMNTAGK